MTESGRPEFSRDELIAELGISPEYVERMWRAFGFAHNTTSDKIFTADEITALRVFADSESTMPERAQTATARAIGQTMSRLADWQADQILELERDPTVPWTREQMVSALGVIQQLIWRCHLNLALERDIARTDDEQAHLVVGFVDIVGYTSLSRRIGMTELEELLEIFEDRSHAIISSHGGHVIKTLGDAVLFTFEQAEPAAATALQLHQLSGPDTPEATDLLPPLRVGLAQGPVLSRLGDVFGEPVNIAARLCGSARPGTTLVDEATADELADERPYFLHSISPLSVRGYRRLKSKTLAANRYYSGTS